MFQFRFNSVFTILMLVSFVSAFIAPPRWTNPARAELQGLFAPISRPVRAVAETVYNHFHPQMLVDEGSPAEPRPDQTILEENRQLRIALESLSVKFDQLSQLNDDRKVVGDIRPLCKPASVTGVDSSGIRESISIGSTSLNAFKNDMPVIFPYGIVGRISRAGLIAAQVRLITDPGVVVTGRIAQYRTDPDGHLSPQRIEQIQPLVQGVGHGAMVIRNSISMRQVNDLGIAVNDTILLDDHDWPANLQGYPIGRITHIQPAQNAPLFADIQVEPEGNLMQLKEVMVMVKE